jgi:hypothetical protein
MLGVGYKTDDWRLFIDSSKRSLKRVLLHNGNRLASVPVAHSVHLKETYENLEQLLEKIYYKQYQWMVCGDLKVLCMLLGQQQGYTKWWTTAGCLNVMNVRQHTKENLAEEIF